MKPDWDKLMDAFAGSATQLVADVDCTAEGKELCEANEVRGYPTIKWGDPSALEDYQGARSYDALFKFAEENLKPMCSPTNIDLCDDDKKAEIHKLQAMSPEDLAASIETEEKKLADAEEEFKNEVTKLQETYQALMDAKEKKVEEVKAAGLSLMKTVQAAAGKKEAKEEL